MLLVSGIEVVEPEHIVCALGVVDGLITGRGLTVIVTVIADPVQPLATGVIVYVTVPELVPVAVKV